MFDIGFWELALIAVLGLVILGPERLPDAIRTTLQWVKTIRKMANNVKEDISQELHLQELNANIEKAKRTQFSALSPELKESLQSIKHEADELSQSSSQSSAEQPEKLTTKHKDESNG